MISKLQYITHTIEGKNHIQLCREACEAGVKWIQLRMKNAIEFDWEHAAVECLEICEDFGATLIINDNVEVADRVMAHGIHLGKEDMKPSEARKILGEGKIVGGTANTFEDIQYLVSEGVDYIGLGPFKEPKTKKKLSPILGHTGYKEIIQKCKEHNINIPIVGIGGVEAEDVDELLNDGLFGVAVSGVITNSNDKKKTIKEFNKRLNS